MLSARDINVLKLLRRYYYARARQVQQRLVPNDDDCSITRSILRRLLSAGLLRKHVPKMVDPLSMNNSAAPIYTITMKGASVLASITNDSSCLLNSEPGFSQWMSLNHACALTSLHMLIDDAITAQSYVKQTGLVFEHEVINPDAKDGSKYLLHMQVSKPGEKLIFCIPDSAFETDINGTKRAWFTEFQTGDGDHPKRVFAKKHQGYEKLADNEGWRRVFPSATSFRVLCFCAGGTAWRDALRKEFAAAKKGKHWGFMATSDLTVESFLHDPIVYAADKATPFPLIPRPT